MYSTGWIPSDDGTYTTALAAYNYAERELKLKEIKLEDLPTSMTIVQEPTQDPIQEAIQQERIEIARRMLELNLDINTIQATTQLSQETIEQLQKER